MLAAVLLEGLVEPALIGAWLWQGLQLVAAHNVQDGGAGD